MSETNKTYRIKTEVGKTDGYINIDTNLVQDYDTLDILSVKISSAETYKLHNSNYGVVVGRVLANNGFGVPNAKISIFIEADSSDGEKVKNLYPFISPYSKDSKGVRYNLLPNDKVSDCHQVVGTFPNKRYMLDNDVVLEVFDKYYKYTTRTNNAGDYLIMGVPVGTYTLHMDLDLSDCGILSQKPRDFVYKGYTIEQFENPSKFKEGKEYNELSQVFSQDQTVNVIPFWGNESTGEQIGITRADINVAFKFETTCVFIGSVISDNASNGITKKCMATENMGNMEEMTTGEGTIEMIRKTPSGEIEEFQVKGTQLIDGNGVWCYQIPMNLDYMMTDEYGNMVPTDDPEKGIPTRTSVRFRISMQDNEENTDNFFRAKVLVPHNPQFNGPGNHEDYDYEFGTKTRDDSFRDLFWDNVYSVKSYIPRFQKRKVRGWRDTNFTGIKSCNFHGSNNPIPYNNMRIRLPLMFTIMCALIKCFIFITGIFNFFISMFGYLLADIGNTWVFGYPFKGLYRKALKLKLNVLSEGLCPDLENWFFSPLTKNEFLKSPTPPGGCERYDLLKQTLSSLRDEDGFQDPQSIDKNNSESEDEIYCLTTKVDYLISCVEMNLAMEYKVINFDFYNDWINGTIYIPRFMRYLRSKKTFLGITFVKSKLKGCMDNTSIFSKTRRYTQMCSMGYKNTGSLFTKINNPLATGSNKKAIKKSNNFHKKNGFTQYTIFGKNGGICHEQATSKKQYVYYMKPCEISNKNKVILFATDIILLGSLKDCDENGLPKAFRYLSSTSYIMPTNLALTNMETNGPLYANGKDTICAGSSNYSPTNAEKDEGIQYKAATTLSEELSIYTNSKDTNIDTKYDGVELSDIIAVTEAAGIAWNYTGPGQGEIVEQNMYYPGGHFLGMSCVNSQSNIKSCVNLSRICEVGASISQRKEDIGEVEVENGESKEIYYYTVPTGFISGNEIIGEDFRTMFATMNQNRLQAVKFNPETGYYYYNFDFIKPINFNGVFNDIAKKGAERYYNTKINLPAEDEEILKKHGISTGSEGRGDYDEYELSRTQTRTIEDTSKDYYKFRFGLNEENLKKTDSVHNSKFLTTSGGYKYLPQYENSYYFYFGMKAGATAIDEFNKQFFSVCDSTALKTGIPIINVNVSDIDICNQRGTVEIILDNIEMPLRLIKLTKEYEDKTTEKNYTNDYGNRYSFIIDNEFLDFGKYHLEIIDSNGTYLTKDFNVGIDLFKYNFDIINFNVYNIDNIISKKPSRDDFLGGYIKLYDILIDEDYRGIVSDNVGFDITETSGKTNWYEKVEEEGLAGSPISLYVNSANTNYSLYLKYKCKESNDWKKVYLNKFTVKDGRAVALNMGWPNESLYVTVTPSGSSMVTYPKMNNDKLEIITSSDSTPYLNFGESTWYDDTNYGKSIILGAAAVDRNELQHVQTKDEIYDEFINGDNGLGGGGGGSYNPSGSQDIGYTPGNKPSSKSLPSINIFNDNSTLGNWIKRVSLYKRIPKSEIHSSNIFTTSGNKVLWGEGQNLTGTTSGVVICSEIDNNFYDFSLDDEATYHNTTIDYSSIGIDDDGVVSGDYFAKQINGEISKTGCYGKYPSKNCGYVFKTIPEGEISYFTYKGALEKVSVINENGETIYPDGVFYSTFNYPVIEKPMKVYANFFIWAEYGITFPENTDGTPEIAYNEMAGRTELIIENGIRYNNNLGSQYSVSGTTYLLGLDVSNITPQNLCNSTSGKSMAYVEGMDVTTYLDMAETTNQQIVIPAYTSNGYTNGVSGITEAYYDITEGYPYINDDIDLSTVVNKVSDSFGYSNYFGDYATYEVKPGEGLSITLHGGGKGSGRGYICLQKNGNDNNQLLKRPTGNDGFVYYQERGGKKPIYHVLCYIDKSNAKDGRFDRHGNEIVSNDGDLLIMRIGYYNNRMCNIRFSYNYQVEEECETQDEGKIKDFIEYTRDECYDLRRDGGWSRGTIGSAKNDIQEIFKLFWDTDKKKNPTYHKFIQPLPNYRIKTNMGNTNWKNTIIAHAHNYQDKGGIINNVESVDGIYYYVDMMPKQIAQDGMGEANLYKIYPILLPSKVDDDGIDLDLYTLNGEVINTNGDIELQKVEGVQFMGKTVLFTVTYDIDHISTTGVTSQMTAKSPNEAGEKLNIKYKNNTYKVYNMNTISGDGWKLSRGGSPIITMVDDTYTVTYTMELEITKNSTTSLTDSFVFYITSPSKGELFNINIKGYEPLLNVYLDDNFANKGKTQYDFESEIQQQVFYVAIKKPESTNFTINKNTTDENSMFDIITETYNKAVNGIDYNALKVTVGIKKADNIEAGTYNAETSFNVEGKDSDERYKIKVKYVFTTEGSSGIWTEPKIVYVYTTGPMTGQTMEIKSNNVEDLDINSCNIGTEKGDIIIEPESINGNIWKYIKDKNKVSFEYTGETITTAATENIYKMSISHNSKVYETTFNTVSVPYVALDVHNMNEDNFPTMVITLESYANSFKLFREIAANKNEVIVPNGVDFINDFKKVKMNVSFKTLQTPLLKRLYYFTANPTIIGSGLGLPNDCIFLNALTNTNNNWDLELDSEKYMFKFPSLGDNIKLKPLSLMLNRVEFGDKYKIEIRQLFNTADIGKEETGDSNDPDRENGKENTPGNGNIDTGESTIKSSLITIVLSNDTDSLGIELDAINPYVIDFSNFKKSDSDVRLCMSVSSTKKIKHILVADGQKELAKIVASENVEPRLFPYQIPILELCGTPMGDKVNNYYVSKITFTVVYDDEE